MAYDEILMIFTGIVLSIVVLGVLLFQAYSHGVRLGHKQAMESMRFVLDNSELRMAKKEETVVFEQPNPVVSPELLMAYGVESTRGLPKEVRSSIGMDDYDEDIELQELIER